MLSRSAPMAATLMDEIKPPSCRKRILFDVRLCRSNKLSFVASGALQGLSWLQL